ncbi:MAG: hypothetical protein JWM47_1579 [Acidimicrobiales bacterium]|nr:hypothetical protein [Acidimicrobiales bacterium]
MRRRLTIAILGVAALAVLLFGLPLGIGAQRLVDEQAALRLERRAVLASRQVPTDFARAADPVELPPSHGVAYGLYDRRGHRVAGIGPTRGDAMVRAALDNEVRQTKQSRQRVAAIPIVDHEAVVGVLRASQPTAVADDRARRAAALVLVLGVAVVAVGAVVARLVAGRLARPVVRLRDQAVRLGDGDFAIEADHSGITELDDADAALVATARRLDDLLQRERAFSADASHQLRTPLAALRTNIESELQFPRPGRQDVLTEALVDIGRLETTIDEILTFARTASIASGTFAVAPLLEGLAAEWHGVLARQGRPLAVHLPREALMASGSGPLVRQALDALVDNAAAHGAGEVRVEVRSTDETVTISVTDGGPGFDAGAAALDHAVSGRTGAGHGLGLSLARRLVESNRGRLVIARWRPHPVVEVVLVRTGA